MLDTNVLAVLGMEYLRRVEPTKGFRLRGEKEPFSLSIACGGLVGALHPDDLTGVLGHGTDRWSSHLEPTAALRGFVITLLRPQTLEKSQLTK